MYLPECLVWAMEEGCSAVKIYCAEDLRADIALRFTEIFNDEYDKVMNLVEAEHGNCYEKEENINPFNGAQIADYGVYLPFDSLALYYGGGALLASDDAGEALEKALKKIKKEFPSIRYDGYIAYSWSDIHSGEVCQYKITSEKKKKGSAEMVYDFVGEALAKALQSDVAWDDLAEELEEDAGENDFKKILKLFHMYSQWIPTDATDRIIGIAENVDEDLSGKLKRFAENLNAGKDGKIKEDEIDTIGFPDGYAEALEKCRF